MHTHRVCTDWTSACQRATPTSVRTVHNARGVCGAFAG